ncbi:MAG: DnaB-like helicase C-terminal domain-containing protein [Armatimonadota bacterium]|nr:DnaB-like helicase C-terminal domain-containing protein [Armatimonadota bacterium]
MELHQVETRVLAGLIRDRHLVTMALTEGFHVDLLPSPQARRLAKVVVELHGMPAGAIDEATLRAALTERGMLSPELDRYLASVLKTAPPNAGDLMGLIEHLKVAESRELLARLHEAIGGYLYRHDREQDDIVQFTTEAIHQLLEIQRRRVRRQVAPIAEAFPHLLAPRASPGAGGILGYSISPFDRLNALLSGLRRGFYYGLAGAPRRGKTNLTLDLAVHVATNHKIPVLYYTWEQTRRVLAARLIAKETGVNPTTILAGVSPNGEPVGEKLEAARERLARYGPYLHLVEAGRRETLDRIRAHAHNLMQEFQTQEVVIFFDYLQKIPLSDHIEDWKARTDRISTALAELSLELNCPVFAISPLDKEGCRLDERPAEEAEIFNPFNRPTMHHSMGSGDLEYDLDVAMVLAKDWKATHDLHQLIETRAKAEGFDPADLPTVDIVNLFVDKNRDAPESASNIVQFAFFVTLNKFVELDYKLEQEYRPDFHGFSKLQDIYTYLREHGYGPQRDLVGTPRPGGNGGGSR